MRLSSVPIAVRCVRIQEFGSVDPELCVIVGVNCAETTAIVRQGWYAVTILVVCLPRQWNFVRTLSSQNILHCLFKNKSFMQVKAGKGTNPRSMACATSQSGCWPKAPQKTWWFVETWQRAVPSIAWSEGNNTLSPQMIFKRSRKRRNAWQCCLKSLWCEFGTQSSLPFT